MRKLISKRYFAKYVIGIFSDCKISVVIKLGFFKSRFTMNLLKEEVNLRKPFSFPDKFFEENKLIK